MDSIVSSSSSIITSSNNHKNENENSKNDNANDIQTASIELERVYANIGDTINLTCYLFTKEVDWHFKDKNLTTTIISNGLQLQVMQPLFINNNNNNKRLKHRMIHALNDDYNLKKKKQRHDRNRNANTNNNFKQLKYKVTSDLHFTHMLGVYVQGEQDEGSYQCIDSVSESPVKKTIVVILSEFLFNFSFHL